MFPAADELGDEWTKLKRADNTDSDADRCMLWKGTMPNDINTNAQAFCFLNRY
jgi:hypothetical protein